jgi:signal transduction histidine kinase
MQQVLSRTLGLHITVKVRAEPGLPLITVDPGQLHTALLNLAINASYAMSTGGTLTMDAQTHGGGNREFVIITITDTGVGMDAVTLDQAFEPFFSTKGPNGSGLGLSMVQGFAEQSGGAVHITRHRNQS